MSERARAPEPTLQPADEAEWEGWLEVHHGQATEAWLKLGRKGCPVASISHAQALDIALSFGWIDAQVRRYDDHFTLRRFTPRTMRSTWSQVNRENVARLIDAGRMRPAGQAQIEAAIADGRWDAAYPPPSRIEVPPDLADALDADPDAKGFFDGLNRTARWTYLYRLHHVTDPARRAQRIEDYLKRLARHETLSRASR